MRVLRRGDAGPDVAEIRSILAGMDLLPPVTGTDDDYGTFDVAVEHAVRAFQQRRGLMTDGIVGPATFQALKGASYHLGSRLLSYSIAAPVHGDDVFTLQDAFIHNYGTHDDLLAAHGLSTGRILDMVA